MSVRDGPDGEVYLPAIYGSDDPGIANLLKLGRETDWVGEQIVRGVGQRLYLVGEEALPIMELTTLEFTDPAPPTAVPEETE
jgi:type VI secretion system protein ImpE